MSRNCLLGATKAVVLIACAILVLPNLGAAVANAQRRPVDDDRDLSKPSRPPRQQSPNNPQPTTSTQNPTPTQTQGRPGSVERRLVGSPVPGIPVRTDSVAPASTNQVSAGPISN